MIAFLILVICLSIYEARELYKKGQTKDMYVLLGCMVFTAAFGITYFLMGIQFSILSSILNILHLEA